MKVAKLMTENVHACDPDDRLEDAARQMWTHDCGFIVVVDLDGKLAGVITDRDVCLAAYAQGRPLRLISVSDVMSRKLWTVSPDDSIAQAEELMRQHQLRRLPVVDDSGQVVGVLSLADLAREAQLEHARGTKSLRRGEVTATLAAISTPRVARGDLDEEPARPFDVSSFDVTSLEGR